MTPNLAIVRIENERWWCPPIPIPLFLLWIPAILLGPFVLLVLWAMCLARGVRFWPVLSVAWGILCALPGTSVRVTADGNRVHVRIV